MTASRQRTYWHLRERRRKPTEYDICTSRLLYCPPRSPSVRNAVVEWYDAHRAGSALRCSDWDNFEDPRRTTYASYTELQHRSETFVDELLAPLSDGEYDRALSADWVAELAEVIAPLRFPAHGLQMCSAYVGSMAPGGRLAVVLLLQTADQLRCVQRLAFRLGQLRLRHPGLGDDARQRWQESARWQPLRRLVERLLVTYDWGEALTALNLVVKPAFDEAFLRGFARRAHASGDEVLHKLLSALYRDSEWQRAWTRDFIAMLSADEPRNKAAIEAWVAVWWPRVRRAFAELSPHYDEEDGATVARSLREEWSWLHLSPADEGTQER